MFYVKPIDGTDFSNWEFRIKILLEQGVLDVTTQVPSTEPDELEKFKKLDAVARMIIIQCVGDNVLEMLKTKVTSKDMMESLSKTYTKTGLSTQIMLQRKLRSLKCIDGMPLSKFLTEFDQIICEFKGAGGTINDKEMVLQ